MAGRPNKYESNVKPRINEILEWLKLGATEKEIAENLGVNQKVFCKYKKEHSELTALIKKGRKEPVQEIKAALYKKAIGFTYQEKKEVRGGDADGEYWKEETYTKYSVPDPTAAMMLLKHWDKETEWTSDPASLELKKQELEMKKKQMENEDW